MSTFRIGVDDHTVLTLNTPSQGFWNEAHLQGDNIWASGGPNAPFDKPVSDSNAPFDKSVSDSHAPFDRLTGK